MPAFQKLITGAAEALMRAQEEQAGHAAAAKAADLYQAQLLEGLKLYHGTPHVFAPAENNPLGQFDFLNYKGSGEGAQAYGPGSYLTGNVPLAEHYATALAAAKNHTRPGPPEAWTAGAKEDKAGFLEYLRARTMAKAQGYGLRPGTSPWVPSEGRVDDGLQVTPNYLSRVDLQNFGPYVDAMNGFTGGPEALNRALANRLRDASAGQRAAGLGRGLLDAGVLSEGAPRITQQRIPDTGWGGSTWGLRTQSLAEAARRAGLDPVGQAAVAPLGVVRRNLNAVLGATGGGQKATYKASMDSSIPLGTLGEDAPERVRARPQLYTAETPATPSELFSYDYPLSVSSPRVVAALASVADRYRLPFSQDANFGQVTGKDFIRSLTKTAGPLNAVKALREAEVPGMYFRRAGERGPGGPPPVFDPNDHNFVWFDDPLLNITNRQGKKEGGLVAL